VICVGIFFRVVSGFMRKLEQAARSIGLSASFRVSWHPSTLCIVHPLTRSSLRLKFSSVCSHPLLLREGGGLELIWSGAEKALFARRGPACAALLPALFDGILDDQTIVGLA
jgi:hypothetical protein